METWDNNTEAGKPTVHRYKTLIQRALNGVRVEGHRAVVSPGTDGRFARVLVKWPPLAREGHQPRTPLTLAEVEQRALVALKAEGVTSGRVKLAWK